MIQLLHYRKLPVLAFFFSMLFLGGTAVGQNTWIGATNQSWFVATNWSTGLVPGPTEAVIFNTSVTVLFPTGNTTIGSLTITGGASVTFTPGVTPNGAPRTLSLNTTTAPALTINSGSTLTLMGQNDGGNNTMTLNFTAGAKTANIAGTLNLNSAGGGDLGVFTATNCVTTVTGTVRNNGGTINSTAAAIIFGTTGIYNHAINGGTIPLATWNAGSTCEITGMVGTAPNAQLQNFSNVTIANPNQTGIFEIRGNIAGIGGNLTVSNTGPSGSVKGTNTNTDFTMTIGGDFVMTGGLFYVEDNSNGGSALTVNGNVSLSGTPTLILSSNTGTATMNVLGIFSQVGGSVDLSNASGIGALVLASNFTQTGGNFGESGTGSGSVNFNGGTTQTYTSTGAVLPAGSIVNYTVTSPTTLQMANAATILPGAGTFDLNAGATLGVRSADGINSGTGATTGNIQVTGARTYAVGSNITYNGTVAQNTGTGIPLAMTGTLTINNAAGVTLNSGESIGTGTVYLQSGVFATGLNLTLANSLIRRGAGSITGTFPGAGDYDVEYLVNVLTGPELQGGQGGATRLRNLTINTASSTVAVPLAALTEMKGVLTLTNGKLSTTATNILRLTATATCPAGGSVASFVNGPMRKIGTAAFVFPIGEGVATGAVYRPVAISGSAASIATALPSSSEVDALVSINNPAKIFNTTYNGDMTSLGTCYYWSVNRTVGTGPIHVWASTGPAGGATINTDYLRACMVDVDPISFPPITASLLRVARYNGTAWDNLNNATPPVTAQASNAWFIGAATGVAAFSPFGVGSAQGVLPVTLTAFTATKNGDAVKLSWETASEQNSAYFDVERSSDGANFSSIGKVNAAGNSSTVQKYNFTDNNPAAGRNYYRLRQVDLDAEFEYSKTVSVNMAANAAVSLYPNPVQSNVMVEYPKAGKGATYKVIAVDGRVMQSGVLQENSTQQNINLGNLPRGQYIMTITNNGQLYNQKIQKQ